jgi:hypothetical protein
MKNSTIAIVALAALAAVGCTRPEQAEMALEANGYTNIQINGHAWFVCGEDDDFSTSFIATGPGGDRVHGAVCSGILKGATVRVTGRDPR